MESVISQLSGDLHRAKEDAVKMVQELTQQHQRKIEETYSQHDKQLDEAKSKYEKDLEGKISMLQK